jgi:hypothetical protein
MCMLMVTAWPKQFNEIQLVSALTSSLRRCLRLFVVRMASFQQVILFNVLHRNGSLGGIRKEGFRWGSMVTSNKRHRFLFGGL